jgi:flagellar P-ring protein precursor FlgI
VLNLNTPDFTTAARLAEGINKTLGSGSAQALDAVSIKVAAPADANQRISYISELERLEIEPGEAPARVIINSRTGTVVISSHVRVMPAAVAHGSLSVTITERTDVSQPNAFSNGTTTVTPRSALDVQQGESRMFMFPAGVNLDAILEALKEAGALRAELIVI